MGLYRAGAIAALLFAILTIVSTVLAYITPQPPSTGAAGTLGAGAATLQFIAANKSVYVLNMVMFLGPTLFTLIVFLALYVSLRHVNKSLAAIGALLGVAADISFLVPFGLVLGLVPLSDEYVAATTTAQRAAVATTADGLIAQVNVVSVGGIVFALGVLVISLAMLKGVFHRNVAYLGIVTGIVGIVCESLRPILGGWYGIYGILLIWILAVGWKLYRMSDPRVLLGIKQRVEQSAHENTPPERIRATVEEGVHL